MDEVQRLFLAVSRPPHRKIAKMKIPFPIRIYLAALVLRLIPVLLTMNLGIGLDDMFQYDMLARSLASGHGFRWYAQDDLELLEPYVDFDLSSASGYDPDYGVYTSFRAPLYPAFLALVYSLNGLDLPRFFAVCLAQAILLGAPLAPLTYFVAQNFFLLTTERKEERRKSIESASRLSAWIVACYPMLLVYPLGLGTENLFFILLLSSFFSKDWNPLPSSAFCFREFCLLSPPSPVPSSSHLRFSRFAFCFFDTANAPCYPSLLFSPSSPRGSSAISSFTTNSPASKPRWDTTFTSATTPKGTAPSSSVPP
jgi:hypothetical protein